MTPVKLFLDSADLDELIPWIESRVIDGITTNPTILRQLGVQDWLGHLRDLAGKTGDLPINIQVTAREHHEMINQATMIVGEIEHAVVKVPIVSSAGDPNLATIAALSERGIPVNTTACLAVGQAVLAAKAGARYTSLLWGRIGDEGADPASVVSLAADLLPRVNDRACLLVGSIRTPNDVTGALAAGAHAVTVRPALLRRWTQHHHAAATVAQFYRDAEGSDMAGA